MGGEVTHMQHKQKHFSCFRMCCLCMCMCDVCYTLWLRYGSLPVSFTLFAHIYSSPYNTDVCETAAAAVR